MKTDDQRLYEAQSMQRLCIECSRIIRRARDAGVTIDRGNVVDLLADQLTFPPLADLRVAAIILGEL